MPPTAWLLGDQASPHVHALAAAERDRCRTRPVTLVVPARRGQTVAGGVGAAPTPDAESAGRGCSGDNRARWLASEEGSLSVVVGSVATVWAREPWLPGPSDPSGVVDLSALLVCSDGEIG